MVAGSGEGLDTVNGGTGNDIGLGIGGNDVFYYAWGRAPHLEYQWRRKHRPNRRHGCDDILDFSIGPLTLTSIKKSIGGEQAN